MCIDNETQYVVAVVGGRMQNDQYNRAFFQSGSPVLPSNHTFDYAPAIDNGVINGSTVINDHKVYWDNTNKKLQSSNSGGGYHGNVTVREGPARSLNTVAFRFSKSRYGNCNELFR